MKTIGKITLWSFLVFGILFLFGGVYLYVSGSSTPGVVKGLIIAGTGQLVIFNVLFFLVFRKLLKDKSEK